MFVVTPELKEVLRTFKIFFRVLKNPRAFLKVCSGLLLFITLYFGITLLG